MCSERHNEVKRVVNHVQVVPTRKVRGKAPAGAAAARGKAKGAGRAAEAIAAPAAALDPQDLLPRADISGAITPNLADRFGRCGRTFE